ncbi:DUF6464 family protein [Microcoleus sp. FACHB-68]|uniref:DUF6464 family protein n=1 Tax=Microcoleus sp. FACHB-68 TaxID=2692826 RepID=UPI001683BEBF|nr:hypothetical protein [Microcoleus sp. FACHB-68]
MLEILLIFILGLTPPLLSLWSRRLAEARATSRLRAAREAAAARGLRSLALSPDTRPPERVGQFLGDPSCRFNAKSAYIRCAVNPIGPCQDCPQYQPREDINFGL